MKSATVHSDDHLLREALGERNDAMMELQFFDSPDFRPYGADTTTELRLTVPADEREATIDRLLEAGWGLASVREL